MTELIRAEVPTKYYGRRRGLAGLDLDVRQGEVYFALPSAATPPRPRLPRPRKINFRRAMTRTTASARLRAQRRAGPAAGAGAVRSPGSAADQEDQPGHDEHSFDDDHEHPLRQAVDDPFAGERSRDHDRAER